jgi:hypothetical protein
MTMTEPAPTLEPNAADMARHLELLFAHATEYDDGLIEIAVNTGKGWQGQLFGLDCLDHAVEFAAARNQAGCNAYVGVALRDPDAPPMGRSSDGDHYATTVVGGDLDTAQASAAAIERTRHLPPTFVVCTGQHPHIRLQPFWRLTEAVTDPEQHRQLFGGVADCLDGDRVITNPGRIMRLAGSIAWPTKPGRVAELTSLLPVKDPSRAYSAEAIAKAYPNQHKVHALDAAHKNDPIERVAAKNSLGLDTGLLDDGREAYMRDTIMAVLVEIIGTTGSVPNAQELFDAAWPQYSAKVDLFRPGRGQDEMHRKIQSTLRRFDRGNLKDRRGRVLTLDTAVEEWRGKQVARQVTSGDRQPLAALGTTSDAPGGRFQWLTSSTALSPILNGNWLIKNVLPAEGLGVIFGRPGSGKTFSVMDIAMHVAGGIKWRGKKVTPADVSYVSPEAGRLGVNRVIGWSRHHGIAWPQGFRLSPASINLCSDATDAEALVADIKANQPSCRLVVIDTLNRAMAGGDENSGEDMGRFVALCDHIAKELRAFVLVVHHSGKDAAKGSRGHSSLLGAVSLELEVTKEQGQAGTIKVTKMRDGEDGAEYGFDIDSVPLGQDEDGEEVTTGIAVEADMGDIKQARKAEPRGQVQKTIADAFSQFADDYGRPNPPGTGFAEPGMVRVVEEAAFTDFAAGKLLGDEKRKRVRQGIRGMIENGYFVVNNGLIWRV